ncbi:MAG: DEAD/DEAH box helicase [Nannocystales bacterium]
MTTLDDQIKTTLAVLVVGASVTTLVKSIRRAFTPKALPTNSTPNPRVRAACERMVERGELIRRERGHTYYTIDPTRALAVLRTLEPADLHAMARALEEPRDRTVAGAPTWWVDARIAVALEKPALIRRARTQGSRSEYDIDQEALAWINIAGESPPPGLLAHFSDALANEYCALSFEYARGEWNPVAPEVLEQLVAGPAKTRRELAGYLALRGDFETARTLAGSSKETRAGVELMEAFFRGALDEAAEVGLQTCAALKRKNKVLTGEAGLLHTLACIAVSSTDPRGMPHAQAAVLAGASRSRFYENCYVDLVPIVAKEDSRRAYFGEPPEPHGGMEVYVRTLSELWSHDTDTNPALRLPPTWPHWRARAADSPTLETLMKELERAYEGPEEPPGLAGAFVPRAAWEVALDALEVSIRSLGNTDEAKSKKESIVWVITGHGDSLHVGCKLRGPRSRKGRNVSLLTLIKKANADELLVTPQDQVIVDACVVERDEWTGRRVGLFTTRAICALAEHPRVEDDKGQSLSVRREQPRVVLDTTDSGATLSVSPPQLFANSVALVREGDTVGICERPASWKPLLDELPSGTLEVPKGGVARLERLAAALAEQETFTVEGLSFGDRTVEADPRVLARLTWDGRTLAVELRSAPFGAEGPHYPVGEGAHDAVRQGPQGLVGARRRFDDEVRRARELQAVLPGDWSGQTDQEIVDLDDALAVVETLEALGETIQRAWPAKQLRVRSGSSGTDTLQVKVRKAEQWFAADLSLRVDDVLVLGYAQLLRGREGGQRYIELGKDEYLALTQEMTRRLDAMQAFASDRDNTIVMHPAAAESLGLTQDTPGVELDKAANARLASIRKARALQPRLPRTFTGTLRDYQREGFLWLARLCAAGLGACLADDMGLGKTVQTIALLCLRKKEGPALVVCPTSVVANWQEEFTRFAPKLRVSTLGTTGRPETIEGLTRGDVLLISYGLLVREQEALSGVEFGTVVFDEAHALKTPTSQRAKAAFRLDARARVTLTGTPVENHLGELWSVMNASVPGLLGSKHRFDERLGRPVLRHHAGALDRLRAILDPFVLRRRRSEVLTELPELTEVTVRVPPTDAQAAYYEVLRKRAMETLEEARKDPTKARIRVLAEITRLRQAAIDPRLLDEDLAPAGSKLDQACERVAALHADGHRCLVFTQFLGCIRRLDERLSDLGLEVLTLDGSTPAPIRKARIDAFQRGEADAFVMSLKAGGVGINLTAAQYVIHMDPWWNPAVEEQATARSHRMGQRDPVTVYRLITEGSIEEQILDLHERKRGLAQDLLGGMANAKALDLEALRGLLEA